MRYLAIDLGDKRTGIAVGDRAMRLATPVGVLEIPIEREDGRALLEAIVRSVADQLGESKYAPGELVLGLPFNMDGTEGHRARKVREFGERIRQRTGRTLHLHDERLTTAAADWSMAQSGLTHKQKKERRDALAACAMLQSFLNALEQPGGSPAND